MQPDPRAWTSLFAACREGGQPERGLELFRSMIAAGHSPAVQHFNILIDALAKARTPRPTRFMPPPPLQPLTKPRAEPALRPADGERPFENEAWRPD